MNDSSAPPPAQQSVEETLIGHLKYITDARARIKAHNRQRPQGEQAPGLTDWTTKSALWKEWEKHETERLRTYLVKMRIPADTAKKVMDAIVTPYCEKQAMTQANIVPANADFSLLVPKLVELIGLCQDTDYNPGMQSWIIKAQGELKPHLASIVVSTGQG